MNRAQTNSPHDPSQNLSQLNNSVGPGFNQNAIGSVGSGPLNDTKNTRGAHNQSDVLSNMTNQARQQSPPIA
jgi:hypothetical protein